MFPLPLARMVPAVRVGWKKYDPPDCWSFWRGRRGDGDRVSQLWVLWPLLLVLLPNRGEGGLGGGIKSAVAKSSSVVWE